MANIVRCHSDGREGCIKDAPKKAVSAILEIGAQQRFVPTETSFTKMHGAGVNERISGM